MATKAAFWIVTEAYLGEAERSANSFAQVMPDIERWVFSHDVISSPSFQRFHQLKPRSHHLWYGDFIAGVCEALTALPEHVLMVDSDTLFLMDVYELFELLEKFDLAGIHALARRTGPTVQRVPDAFPEFNTGLFAMRNNQTIKQVWAKTFERFIAHSHIYGNTDQAPLRETLWYDFDGKMYVTPLEYHCRYQHGVYAFDPVRVLHGRVGDLEEIGKAINKTAGHRIWQLGDL